MISERAKELLDALEEAAQDITYAQERGVGTDLRKATEARDAARAAIEGYVATLEKAA